MNILNVEKSGSAYASPRIREMVVFGHGSLCQNISKLVDSDENGDPIVPGEDYTDIFDD